MTSKYERAVTPFTETTVLAELFGSPKFVPKMFVTSPGATILGAPPKMPVIIGCGCPNKLGQSAKARISDAIQLRNGASIGVVYDTRGMHLPRKPWFALSLTV